MSKKTLKDIVDEELRDMLKSEAEPSEGRMKLIAIALKKIAIDAKLEEDIYGDYFQPAAESGSPAGDEKGAKPSGRRRANGADEPAAIPE